MEDFVILDPNIVDEEECVGICDDEVTVLDKDDVRYTGVFEELFMVDVMGDGLSCVDIRENVSLTCSIPLKSSRLRRDDVRR